MTECPCCSHPMIRRFRQKLVYWFCRHCWEAMPEGNFNISLSLRSVSLVTASEELGEEHSSLPSTSINLATELGIKKQKFSLSIYDYAPT